MSGCIGGVDKTLAQLRRSMYFALQSLPVSGVTDLHKALAEIHSFRGKPRPRCGMSRLWIGDFGGHRGSDDVGRDITGVLGQRPPARDSRLSGYLGCNRRSIVSRHQPSGRQPRPACAFRSGDGDDVLCARAVSASHRCRFDVDRGTRAHRSAKCMDASWPVAGALQYGRICLVPISPASNVWAFDLALARCWSLSC